MYPLVVFYVLALVQACVVANTISSNLSFSSSLTHSAHYSTRDGGAISECEVTDARLVQKEELKNGTIICSGIFFTLLSFFFDLFLCVTQLIR